MDKEYLDLKLEATYGRDLDNRPKFRIVWSNDCVEKRFGEFTDVSDNGIFLRTVREVREVRKYPWLDRWMLEKTVPFREMSIPNPELHITEVVYSDGYECIWKFEHTDGTYQEPNWRAIKLLCHWLVTGQKHTVSDHEEEDRKKLLEEQETYFELLGGKPGVSDALAMKEGVFLDSTKVME